MNENQVQGKEPLSDLEITIREFSELLFDNIRRFPDAENSVYPKIKSLAGKIETNYMPEIEEIISNYHGIPINIEGVPAKTFLRLYILRGIYQGFYHAVAEFKKENWYNPHNRTTYTIESAFTEFELDPKKSVNDNELMVFSQDGYENYGSNLGETLNTESAVRFLRAISEVPDILKIGRFNINGSQRREIRVVNVGDYF